MCHQKSRQNWTFRKIPKVSSAKKVNKYLTEIKGNKTVESSNPGLKLSKSKIKHYAVNDMRTANERQLKRDALSIKKIQTVEGD